MSDVEERIHRALEAHALERTELGYRRVHETGVSLLRILRKSAMRDTMQLVAVAEIDTKYHPGSGFPSFHESGVQRLNAMAVHGAFHLDSGKLRQTAQYSIYSNESAAHLAAQSILDAFGGQMAIGRSIAMATRSAAAQEQQRAHHARPRQWRQPLDEDSLKATTVLLRGRGLAAANDATSVWAELPLSGNCPSRTIDRHAQTALLQVNVGVAHPIAGAGYLATLLLPLARAPAGAAEICRRLNALELEQSDFVPRLGAWGLRGTNELPGYTCFIPCAEPWNDLHTILMSWCLRRAVWIRDRWWSAQQGLTLEALRPGKPAP